MQRKKIIKKNTVYLYGVANLFTTVFPQRKKANVRYNLFKLLPRTQALLLTCTHLSSSL